MNDTSRKLDTSTGFAGVPGSLLFWLEDRRAEETKKQRWVAVKVDEKINHGAKARAFAEVIDYVKTTGALVLRIRLERDDTIPAFGAFCRCEAEHDDSPVILLNVQGVMSPEVDGEDGAPIRQTSEERKRLLITTLMHEFGHALEYHLRLPVNEAHIEAACEAWDRAHDGANERAEP